MIPRKILKGVLKMKRFTVLFLAAILALAFVLPVQAASLNLVAAHNQTSPENPYQIGMLKFKEVLEKLSGGDITVDVHAGTIGTNEDELVEKLKLGAADVVVASPGFMTKIGIPEVDLFSLLYLFNSFDHWEKAVDGEAGSTLAGIINEKSKNTFRIGAYWSAGVRNYYGKKPINSIQDLKGMKIRTQMSGVVGDFWKQVGAIPTNVAWGELYQALQQGVVDCAENDYTNFSLLDHHKAANGKFTTETEHDFTTRFVLLNGKKFDNLTDQQKEWITEALKESTAEERKVTYAMLSESKAKVIAEGGTVNSIDKAPFIAIAIPIQDKLAQDLGIQDLVEKVRDADK